MDTRKEIEQLPPLLNQPKEILSTVFSFFNQKNLSYAGATCKQLNALSKEAQFKALPMPEFDYKEIVSLKKLPSHMAYHGTPDYMKLLFGEHSLLNHNAIKKNKNIYYLFPFAEGIISFRGDSIIYDYLDKDQHKASVLSAVGLKYEDDAVSACALSDKTFVVGCDNDAILCYQKLDDQSFSVKRYITVNYNASIVGFVKKNETDFLAVYKNGVMMSFQLKDDRLSQQSSHTINSFVDEPITVTAIAKASDGFLLGCASGRLLYYREVDAPNQFVIEKLRQNTNDEICRLIKIEENVIAAFTDRGQVLIIDYKNDQVLGMNKELHKGMGHNIKFIIPLDNGQWLIRDKEGDFHLQQLKFKKELQLVSEEVESDNSLKPGFK